MTVKAWESVKANVSKMFLRKGYYKDFVKEIRFGEVAVVDESFEDLEIGDSATLNVTAHIESFMEHKNRRKRERQKRERYERAQEAYGAAFERG